MEIKVNGGPYFMDFEAAQMWDDWMKLSPDAFYEKYPHLKPEYPKTKVTLDEADK